MGPPFSAETTFCCMAIATTTGMAELKRSNRDALRFD